MSSKISCHLFLLVFFIDLILVFKEALNFFPKGGIDAPSIPEILSDLVDTNYMNGGKTSKYPHDVQNEFQEYFRTLPCGNISSKGDLVDEHEYSKHSQKVIDRFEKTIRNEGAPDPNFVTKKFAQRMLPKQWSSKGPITCRG